MDGYVLGILWAIGTFTEEEGTRYILLRHKERYFLDEVKKELDVTAAIHTVTEKGKTQYRLKVHGYDTPREMERLGWQPRWSEQRGYPNITEHRDFIRAYIEIHSRMDVLTIRKRDRPPQKQPRLRIYGNRSFLEGLTQVLASEAGIGVKKVQKATEKSVVSGILYYTSAEELRRLMGYLYESGVKYFYREAYEQFREVMGLFDVD